MKLGLIHGRFQLFHNGHLEYMLQAMEQCDHLIIGITNPDPTLTKLDPVHPARSSDANNPFTYYERLLMIQQTCIDLGIDRSRYTIVPFPINVPELLPNYAPTNAICYTRVYEEWNKKKTELLEAQGYTVEVLFESTPDQKTHSFSLPIGGVGETGKVLAEEGASVRKRIMTNEMWEAYVPAGAAKIMKEYNLTDRIRSNG